MKVGNLVRIRHNEYQGFFIVISHSSRRLISGDQWIKILSLKDGDITHELCRSLEVISESR